MDIGSKQDNSPAPFCTVGDTATSTGGPCIGRGVIEFSNSPLGRPAGGIGKELDWSFAAYPSIGSPATGSVTSIAVRPSTTTDNSVLWADAIGGTTYLSSLPPAGTLAGTSTAFPPQKFTDSAVKDFLSNLDNALGFFAFAVNADSNPTTFPTTNNFREVSDQIDTGAAQSDTISMTYEKPSGYWRFDDAVGSTTAADSSDNLFTGTLLGTTPPGFVADTGAVGGHAFSFNGGNLQRVGSIGAVSSFSFIQNTVKFTISANIKLTDNTATTVQAIAGNTATTCEKGFFFVWENRAGFGTKQLRIDISKGVCGTPVIDVESPINVITDNNWHRVSVVGDGTNIKFYVDGTAYTTVSATPTSGSGTTMGTSSSGDSSRVLSIGVPTYSSVVAPFNGNLDDVRIYDEALTQNQVSQIPSHSFLFSP